MDGMTDTKTRIQSVDEMVIANIIYCNDEEARIRIKESMIEARRVAEAEAEGWTP